MSELITKSSIEEAHEMANEPAKGWVPKVIQGGKGGGGGSFPTGDIWLLEIEAGTTFLIEDRKDNTIFTQGVYTKMFQSPKSSGVLLYPADGSNRELWVNPIKFSNKFKLVDILTHHDLTQEQEETDNGNDKGTVQSVGMEDHADVEAQPTPAPSKE